MGQEQNINANLFHYKDISPNQIPTVITEKAKKEMRPAMLCRAIEAFV